MLSYKAVLLKFGDLEKFHNISRCLWLSLIVFTEALIIVFQDKEVANGGTAPRMLCLDDYFMVETEKVVEDPETGKNVKKTVNFSVVLFELIRLTIHNSDSVAVYTRGQVNLADRSTPFFG